MINYIKYNSITIKYYDRVFPIATTRPRKFNLRLDWWAVLA